MATRDEIADAIAGMALFADLARPQLLGVASRFEVPPEGGDHRLRLDRDEDASGHGC